MAEHVLIVLSDPLLLARLTALAERMRLGVRYDDGQTDSESPLAAVTELEAPGAVERIGRWRVRWPDALLAGSIRLPDQELWHGALAAGADLVANRGAFVIQLERALLERTEGEVRAAVSRLPMQLMPRQGDGLVGRLPDAPGGAIAVFRIGEILYAVRDECPHAGASLADGALDGKVITCPLHGSQFDVTNGARERGPADFPIRTYRVVAEADRLFVEVPS